MGSRSVALPWTDALPVSVRPLLTDFFSHLSLGALLSLQAATTFSVMRSRIRDGETDKGRDLIRSVSQHPRHRVVVTEQNRLGGKKTKIRKIGGGLHFLLFMLFLSDARAWACFSSVFFRLVWSADFSLVMNASIRWNWWTVNCFYTFYFGEKLEVSLGLESCRRYSPHGLHLLANERNSCWNEHVLIHVNKGRLKYYIIKKQTDPAHF